MEFRESTMSSWITSTLWFALGMSGSLWLSGVLNTELGKPLALAGDHLFLLVQIKSFLNGYGLRFNPDSPECRTICCFRSST
ncbi:hypothetical protein [Bradyrhizobium cenepequi]